MRKTSLYSRQHKWRRTRRKEERAGGGGEEGEEAGGGTCSLHSLGARPLVGRVASKGHACAHNHCSSADEQHAPRTRAAPRDEQSMVLFCPAALRHRAPTPRVVGAAYSQFEHISFVAAWTRGSAPPFSTM
ncbi:unnamed protein product [Prorocentrum cordatum]|uniref:Uncharacterized protein n=1 Tax=Prorocentrum cordatum TaxID=2364126 RepID=A0ABN9XQG9_9DINO|nr:unnamed protein product [Polarella glacialis]